MELLEQLVRNHRFTRNRNRLNVSDGEVVEYLCRDGKRRPCLRKGILSNTLRSGPILDQVRAMLGEGVRCVCLNKGLQAKRHTDKKNAGLSYVCYFGSFTGGALCLDDGRRFEGTGQWHGPFDGAAIPHWNEPHEGKKFSVVAFT